MQPCSVADLRFSGLRDMGFRVSVGFSVFDVGCSGLWL